MHKFWLFFAILFLVVSPNGKAFAGVTTIQELNFGEFIVKNNDAVHSITVNITGTAYTFDAAGFIPIDVSNIQPGIYDLDGMTPGALISSVDVTQVLPLSGGGGPNFQLTAFQDSHPTNVDGSGVVRVRVGATAQTNGAGIRYFDQTYTGTMQIQVNF
ncbi:MAG: DUF4402 domain-containing protein [Pseudomonadota bacterium]